MLYLTSTNRFLFAQPFCILCIANSSRAEKHTSSPFVQNSFVSLWQTSPKEQTHATGPMFLTISCEKSCLQSFRAKQFCIIMANQPKRTNQCNWANVLDDQQREIVSPVLSRKTVLYHYSQWPKGATHATGPMFSTTSSEKSCPKSFRAKSFRIIYS
jgi:hypothetical protein